MNRSNKGISFALITVLVLLEEYMVPTPMIGAENRAFDESVSALLKGLRSEPLRKLVKEKAREVRTVNLSTVRKEAVACFYDLRAREVLLALLASDSNLSRNAVLEHYMGIFGVESIPRLYSLAHSKASESVDTIQLFEIELDRDTLVKAVSSHAAKVLGVAPPAFPSTLLDSQGHATTKKELRDWWIKMLKAAQKKNAGKSAIDPILRAIEQQDPK